MKSKSIFQPLRNIVLFLIISCVLFVGIFGLVGCGSKDNPEPTPDISTTPEVPTTPEEPPIEEPPIIEKEYIKVYFGPPIKNYSIVRGYFDGENGLFFDTTVNRWIKHLGVDLTSDEDNIVVSMYKGVVLSIEEQTDRGCVVVIDYGENLIATYYSLGSVSVTVGQELNQDDIVGTIGFSQQEKGYTDNLCLEMTLDGITLDPTPYIEGKEYREVEKE